MKYLWTVMIACVAAGLFSIGGAFAQQGALYNVQNAYAYATAQTQKNGAVFFTLENTGKEKDKLIAANGEVADKIELHTHMRDGDKMMMRAVESYDIPAGKPLKLDPLGRHIMLMGLKAPLKAGESFPLTLSFEKHPPLSVDVKVVQPGEQPEQHKGHHHEGHHE